MQSESSCTCGHSTTEEKGLAGKEIFGTAKRSIDVHHHLEPSGLNVDGSQWSIEMALDELDRNSIATAIGYAGPIFPDDVQSGRKIARETNEWSAHICRDHPGRFGLFASLPLSDIAGSLSEIAYGFDVLHADGVGLATHYDGRGLGDSAFRPIFEELNRRRAVVYVHPSGSPRSITSSVTYQSPFVSPPWIEFPTNTARTILSLWTGGTTRDFPDVTFLFCHGGGVLPILLGRFAGFSGWRSVGPDTLAQAFPNGVYAEFGKLYFELAQAYAPETITMLRSILPASHLLYGSDYSYFPVAHSVEMFAKLDLPADVRTLIGGDNAAALLPRWSG